MTLPRERGALTRRLFIVLRDGGPLVAAWPDPTREDDEALALWTLHELCYRGFADVPDDGERRPDVVVLRHDLEARLERRLRERYAAASVAPASDDERGVPERIFALVEDDDSPSLARFVRRHADLEQVLVLLRWRSVYHLKEADPTAWVVPRLPVRAKAALMELQFDEYGAGDPAVLHHELFARGLRALGLDDRPGGYVDEVPLEVLEQNNALSLLGMQRRLRGAAVGHLAAFEATSSVPSRQMAQGLDRLGVPPEMGDYYRAHVTADAVHEQLAARAICGTLVDDEPHLADDVLLGAWTCLDLEARTATRLLASWREAVA